VSASATVIDTPLIAPAVGKPVRVLLADDTFTVRFLLRQALEASGAFEVVAEAGDGQEAVDQAILHRPELVLLDLAMPVMDGLQALPRLRAGAPDSVVVVLSGFTAERMEPQAVALGAAGYLEKSGSPIRLVESILALIRGDQGVPTVVATPAAAVSPDPESQRPFTFRPPAPAPLSAEQKSQILADMSHELRRPLNRVVQATELLAHAELPPEVAEWSEMVRSSSDALDRAANDILEFAKTEAGLVVLERKPFKVQKIVDDALAMMRFDGMGKGLALLSDVGPGVPEVCLGDAGRLRQVLDNLLANALRFTEKGFVRISVRAEPMGPGPRTRLAFAVTDSGIGVAPQHLSRLFERFTQADESTGRLYGGTGLGLNICHRLVALMDGDMSVTSVPGEGSTFTARVVLDRAYELPVEPGALASVATRHRGRVLLFEDDTTTRHLMVQRLENFGFEAVACATAVDGLARFRGNGPFLAVLMDSQLPDMDGVDVARTIRRIEAEDSGLGRTPIIALTGASRAEDRERCFEAGMDDFLVKPAQGADLFATLTRWATPD
jgi:signal transduction histidine kinase